MKLCLVRAALLAFALASPSAFAHSKLEMSDPANGASLASAPVALKFQFNEPVEAAISTVRLLGPGNTPVAVATVRSGDGDPRTLVVGVPKLVAGEYRAQWATAGHDGHKVRGEIRFTVR